jgi:glutaredoxin
VAEDDPRAGGRRRTASWVLAAMAIAWLGLLQLTADDGRAPIACGADLAPDRDTLVMLSASWCGYCRRARDFLQESGIRHCEYDIETTAEGRRRFAALPLKIIPVLSVRDATVVGYDRDGILAMLAAHGLTADAP